MTAVSEYELAVLNIFYQYVWKYIISVIGTSRLSLSHTRGLKSPNSYEIAYDKSLSLAPTHPCTIISCIGDLTGWRYDDMKNDHIAQH